MAPKKDPKKGKAEPTTEIASQYVKREPIAPEDPPDTSEAEVLWKQSRNAFVLPLPAWDDEAVNTIEWKPNETETLYTSETFSAKVLPKAFTTCVWKRASSVSDMTSTEEPEPQAQPLPELEEEPPAPVDPKAKAKADPKAKAKAAAKGAPAGDASARATTAEQYADFEPSGDACVVSLSEFKTREFALTMDDALPPVCQSIASQFAIISEHRSLLPKGSFLWELIYPQSEEGMPLYNPHGKYVVKLFQQGAWRQVLVDDVMPVGAASSPQGALAPMLPASSMSNVIWPQLLAKALIVAFQADLRATALPVVTALTGWLPTQSPILWDTLSAAFSSRAFCSIQIPSQVDLEAKQREALLAAANSQVESEQRGGGRKAGGVGGPPGMQSPVPMLNLGGAQQTPAAGVPVPKLGAQPNEALLEFLVCEMESEPMQLRVKAGTWKPVAGTPRKTVIKDAESEAEEEEEDAQPRVGEEMVESELEEQDNEDDDEEHRSQRSPSGGEPEATSARVKEEGENEEANKAPEDQQADEDAASEASVCPWRDSLPDRLLMLKSEATEYQKQLQGGYWVSYDALKEVCESFTTHVPPTARVLKASHDTSWARDRDKAFSPGPDRLLRIVLKQDPGLHHRPGTADKDKKPLGDPWHRLVLCYEPLRPHAVFGEREAATEPTRRATSCLLQCVNSWQPSPPDAAAPQFIHLTVEETPEGGLRGGGGATQSIILPPGEHWYLVSDDATKAGSTLSVYADGSLLDINESKIDFLDPAEALEGREVPVVSLAPLEYPAQVGFSLWTKAEVTLTEEAAASATFLQLLSHLSDAAVRAHLKLSFLQLRQRRDEEGEDHCASWSVKTLLRAPLQRMMALPLTAHEGGNPEGDIVKFILMLESMFPTVALPGSCSLQLMPPPGLRLTPKTVQNADGEEQLELPLQLAPLKTDCVLRWGGETEQNDKGTVLCERILAPMGAGSVTAMARIEVSGLPQVYLTATLIAQLPPKEETRPRKEDGSPPDPLVPGAPIDPRDFGGRRNWLARCVPVAEACGVEVVVFPHLVFAEGSTYILSVKVDPFRGPSEIEGGQWRLELFGSGEVEVGADTMEKDLEVLVRKSWEDPNADASQGTRQEKAASARAKWLKTREGAAEEEEENAEEVEAGAIQEFLAAKARCEEKQHVNHEVADFVKLHTVVAPVLDMEDPYTIAPDPPLIAKPDSGEAGEEGAAGGEEGAPPPEPPAPEEPTGEDAAAIKALGMVGLQAVRQAEVADSISAWEKADQEMESTTENNTFLLGELNKWCEEDTGFELKCMDGREKMRSLLQTRLNKSSALEALVRDEEQSESEPLKAALEEAKEAGVGTWNKELVIKAETKLDFMQAFATFKAALGKAEEEPPTEQEAKDSFAKVLTQVKDLLAQLRAAKVPLPAEMCDEAAEELFNQANELLRAATPEAGGEAA